MVQKFATLPPATNLLNPALPLDLIMVRFNKKSFRAKASPRLSLSTSLPLTSKSRETLANTSSSTRQALLKA